MNLPTVATSYRTTCDLKHTLAGNKAYLGRAQGRKFVANVCVVRVAKVSGDSMNRKRFIRFKRLFQEFFYSRGFTNPRSPGPLPPMTLARPSISSSDLVAEVSVGLIEPFSVCVAHSPRNV